MDGGRQVYVRLGRMLKEANSQWTLDVSLHPTSKTVSYKHNNSFGLL
jgi:hypothetical protein